jgi:hypothetical protein
VLYILENVYWKPTGSAFPFAKHSKKKFVVYMEGTLCPLISLLEIGREIMPTYYWCKNPLIIIEK